MLLVAAVGGVVLGSHARAQEARPSRSKGSRRPVDGPEIAWYLALSAILFVTGALGVLVRRSPLIILL